jgi:RND family efflux transporter MFP subunit
VNRTLCTIAIAACACTCACRQTNRGRSDQRVPEPLAETNQATAGPEAPSGFIGVLTPKEQAEVVAPFATSVKSYAVAVGQIVEQNAPLAVLDDQPLRAQLETTTADLRTARTQQAQAYAALANQKKMLKAGTVSMAAVQDAAYAAETASTKVEHAKAEANAVKVKLQKTTLLAPIAGKVSVEYVKVGGHVAESDPVVRVISSDELFVRFAIPTDQVDRIAVQTPLDIVVDTGGQRVAVHGIVTSVAPELDPIARTIVGEAELVDDPKGLKAGLVCRVKLAVKKK